MGRGGCLNEDQGDEADGLRGTALETSAERGYLELTAMLLDRGARVRVTDERGVAVAQSVAAYGDVALLRSIASAVESREEPRVLYSPALA